MSKPTSIPKKDADFNVRQNMIVTTANTNRTAWNLDADWLDDDVLPKKADWEAAWAAYENPETRTHIITYNKQKKREAYEKVLWKLVKNLQSNPRVTDEDLRAMGIVVPSSTRTPAKVADEAPDMDVDTSVMGRIGVHFFERGSGHKRGKPAGQHCVEIAWMLSDVPPTRWDELTHSAVDTNSPYTFVFEHDQRGKTLYFALRWENTRGEKGPWSDILSAIIP
ncbi:MAG: extracellular solute-binding protein [Prevotellaceae bacterium]|jgi:hypothetical protein|nr:extracellular solute-binding protein [Prevotellaceae bacterium]